MNINKTDMTVRSISRDTRTRLDTLQGYTRLCFGSIIDDAVEALWDSYEADGHVFDISDGDDIG